MELYLASVAPLRDEALFRTALSRVGTARAETVARLRPADRKRLSLGAGLLLRHALRERGLDPDAVRVEPGAHGKPYLPDVPNVCFNLSHSGEYALCAVSDHPVGCDVEKLAAPELRVAERFFAPEELALLRAEHDAAAQARLFYRLWTLKESFLKATGLGLSLPLDCFSVDPATMTVRQTVDGLSYRFREYTALADCCIAVCTAFDGFPDAPETVCVEEFFR